MGSGREQSTLFEILNSRDSRAFPDPVCGPHTSLPRQGTAWPFPPVTCMCVSLFTSLQTSRDLSVVGVPSDHLWGPALPGRPLGWAGGLPPVHCCFRAVAAPAGDPLGLSLASPHLSPVLVPTYRCTRERTCRKLFLRSQRVTDFTVSGVYPRSADSYPPSR